LESEARPRPEMEEGFKSFAAYIALSVETAAAVLIAYGAIEALIGTFRAVVFRQSNSGERKEVWLRFAVWLLLGLEFELAADIVRTAISPNWIDIGQLGAIAVIRTFLNYFLERDLESYNSKRAEAEKAQAMRIAA
jgi:uncharacterized membrane protein